MCAAYNNGYTAQEIFEGLKTQQSCVINGFQIEFEKLLEREICLRIGDRVAALENQVLKLNPLSRTLNLIKSSLEGFVQDLFDFNVLGFRIPRTIVQPISDLVDVVGNLVDTIDNLIAEIVSIINDVKARCENGSDENGGRAPTVADAE